MNKILQCIPFYFAALIVLAACNNTGDGTQLQKDSVSADSIYQRQEIISGADQKEQYQLNKAVDSVAPQTLSSSAAVHNGQDTLHQFIRTADLKFSVPDVVKATYVIEDITRQFNGFVTYTALTSNTDDKTTIVASADSSLETTRFTIVNDIKLRVPNTTLDTTLKSIAALVGYFDYRVIKADDVALQLRSNGLAQKRLAGNRQRLTTAIDQQGKKLAETTDAEERILGKQEQSDNAQIANLSLQDGVAYSTVVIALYQRQESRSSMIANEKTIAPYTPGFGNRWLAALQNGWQFVENVIVFLTQMWSLLLMTLIAWLLYRKFSKKTERKSVV